MTTDVTQRSDGARWASVRRETKETNITLSLCLDGTGTAINIDGGMSPVV